jgi:hypothetical protein
MHAHRLRSCFNSRCQEPGSTCSTVQHTTSKLTCGVAEQANNVWHTSPLPPATYMGLPAATQTEAQAYKRHRYQKLTCEFCADSESRELLDAPGSR